RQSVPADQDGAGGRLLRRRARMGSPTWRLQVKMVVSNLSSDFRRREADIAVRHYRPEGEDLVARQIKESSGAHLHGTPGYLERIWPGSPSPTRLTSWRSRASPPAPANALFLAPEQRV